VEAQVNSKLHSKVKSKKQTKQQLPIRKSLRISKMQQQPPIDKSIINTHNGLKNFGFNCFINTGLQCLKFCKSLREAIADNHQRDEEFIYKLVDDLSKLSPEEKQRIDLKKIDALNVFITFKRIMIDLHKSSGTVNPGDLILACRKYSAHIGMEHLFNGQQCDIQEFVIFILDCIHEIKGRPLEITVADKPIITLEDKIKLDGFLAFKRYFEKNHSWIIKSFYNLLITMIKCSKCHYTSFSYDPNNVLCLPIPGEKIDTTITSTTTTILTLYDCLEHYFGKEVLVGSAIWKCDKCGQREDNFKEYRMLDTPDVLIISLKRFTAAPNMRSWRKNTQLIDIPTILNIAPYKIGKDKVNCNYRLFGVANHTGSLEHGHYYAFCCDLEDPEYPWYNLNDERVGKMSEASIITEAAYMLFYQMIPSSPGVSGIV
jgi:ubiquitin C-terminal hydrolase